MKMVTITIGTNTINARLTARTIVGLEKYLGKNPLNVLMGKNGDLPALGDLIAIFHFAISDMNHGIKLEDTYNLYDEYIEEGGTLTNFITDVIMPIFKNAGFFDEEQLQQAEEQMENQTKK